MKASHRVIVQSRLPQLEVIRDSDFKIIPPPRVELTNEQLAELLGVPLSWVRGFIRAKMAREARPYEINRGCGLTPEDLTALACSHLAAEVYKMRDKACAEICKATLEATLKSVDQQIALMFLRSNHGVQWMICSGDGAIQAPMDVIQYLDAYNLKRHYQDVEANMARQPFRVPSIRNYKIRHLLPV